ncbi:hypothetical protein B7463_g9823, partial [Scytalidium lignicola]
MDLQVNRALTGKVAIVTGAGCKGEEGMGNGRAAALLLAQDGCAVVCVDRDEPLAARTAEIIRQDGRGTSSVAVADVTKAEDCERIVKEAMSTFGRLDILVNNVGIAGAPGNAVEVDMKQWDIGVQINLNSMVLMAKYAIPEMLKNKKGEIMGSIVNISSVGGMGAALPTLLYPATKAAVITMTKAMALHHGRQGIRVNCVSPGSPWTPMVFNYPTITQKIRDSRRNNNMLGTEGTGWDTGYAVRWLAGPEARWITGVNLPVDAGLSSMIPMDVPKFV